MKEVEPSFSFAMRFLWAFIWRTILFGYPIGFLALIIGNWVGDMVTGGNEPAMSVVVNLISVLFTISVPLCVTMLLLNARFGNKRLAVITDES